MHHPSYYSCSICGSETCNCDAYYYYGLGSMVEMEIVDFEPEDEEYGVNQHECDALLCAGPYRDAAIHWTRGKAALG